MSEDHPYRRPPLGIGIHTPPVPISLSPSWTKRGTAYAFFIKYTLITMANSDSVSVQDFLDRTQFIGEMAEQVLAEGPKRMNNVAVTAMRENPAPNVSNFVGLALMLKSHATRLADVGAITSDGNIDWSVLRESELATATASNNIEQGITNVPDEMFDKLQPGFQVDIYVRLNEDEDGQQYLNCQIINVHEPGTLSGEELSAEEVGYQEEAEVPA